jgi:hypothetical protein
VYLFVFVSLVFVPICFWLFICLSLSSHFFNTCLSKSALAFASFLVSFFSFLVSFFFPFIDRPKKIFHGKDCCSLAVTIGAGMNLHPILLHSTRKKCNVGLLSLTKDDFILVMRFLEQVGWQNKERFRRSDTPPPPFPPQCLKFTIRLLRCFLFSGTSIF